MSCITNIQKKTMKSSVSSFSPKCPQIKRLHHCTICITSNMIVTATNYFSVMIVNNLNFNAAWKSALLNVFFYVFEGTIVFNGFIPWQPFSLSLYLYLVHSTTGGVPGTSLQGTKGETRRGTSTTIELVLLVLYTSLPSLLYKYQVE